MSDIPISQQAWQIIKKNKALWVFAVLVGLDVTIKYNRIYMPPFTSEWLQAFVSTPSSFLAFLALVMFIDLPLWVLNLSGKIVLVHQVGAIKAKQSVTGVIANLKTAKHHFGRIFLLSLLFYLPMLIIIIAPILFTLLPMLRGQEPQPSFYAAISSHRWRWILVWVLAVPVALPLSIILEFAIRESILHRSPIHASIKAGWCLLRHNLKSVASIFFDIVCVNIILAIAFALPIGLIVTLMALITPMSEDTPLQVGFITIGVASLLFSALGTVSGAVGGIFSSTCWTLFYIGLDESSSDVLEHLPEESVAQDKVYDGEPVLRLAE